MVSEDPAPRGFLLIFRRGLNQATHPRIVTVVHVINLLIACDTKRRVPMGYDRVFQHIAGCTHQRRRWEGQLPQGSPEGSYLRIVIVTTAVYRGLGSKLRRDRSPG